MRNFDNTDEDQPNKCHRVFVGGLSVNCEDKELREYLQRFGKVLDCEIIRDKHGRSKGYCFATYADRSGLLQSLGKDHVLQGKVFEVREQLDSDKNSELLNEIAKRKLFISNLRSSIDESDLEKFFVKFGAIEEVLISRDPATQQSKGFGFVQFRDGNSVQDALIGQEKRTLKIKNHEVTIKECIPKSQMSRMKKLQKQEESITYYRAPALEDCGDPFSIYSSPLMNPQMSFPGIISTQNFLVSQPFEMGSSHQVFHQNMAQAPMNCMSPYSQQPKPATASKKSKALNANSFSFCAQYQPEFVTSGATSPTKYIKQKTSDNTPKDFGLESVHNSPDSEHLPFNISDEPQPAPRKLDKEQCVKLLAMMQADTAPNSLAGSFASQDTALPAAMVDTPLSLNSCKCEQRSYDLSQRPSNLFTNLKEGSCPFGSCRLDETLISAGLDIKRWGILAKPFTFNDYEKSLVQAQASTQKTIYDSLHGFSLSSSKYKLLSDRQGSAAVQLLEGISTTTPSDLRIEELASSTAGL